MSNFIAVSYRIVDNKIVRLLSLILSLILAGCVLWSPQYFAAKTSPVSIWQGIGMIWSVCAGLIHGVGYQLKRSFWQLIFNPLLALCILIVGISYFFFLK